MDSVKEANPLRSLGAKYEDEIRKKKSREEKKKKLNDDWLEGQKKEKEEKEEVKKIEVPKVAAIEPEEDFNTHFEYVK